MNANNEEPAPTQDDFFKQYYATPEQEKEIMEELSKNLKIKHIASKISEFFYAVKSKNSELDWEVEDQNKDKNSRHDDLIGYSEIIQNEIGEKLKSLENFESKEFSKEYTQDAYERVKGKLKILNKEEMILGLEYVLDRLIAERLHNEYLEQFEEKVELEDIYDSVAISNIENYLGR
ncbi:hypothetical protein [Acinetobacter sp. G11]|uniref:hypothetical protein n=1 Tax=Acinetobacter sp. G11 TaxID=3415989 RepID=UPI003C7CF21C